MAELIEITVNGEPVQLAAGSTVAELVVKIGQKTERVAVERNRVIIPKAQHAATSINSGDRFEIVTFVGGG